MGFPLTLVSLAGGVALLLWGTRMVHTGVQRAFGPQLRSILGAALRNRGRGFLAGLGITALLQSSTATGLMTAAFAAEGLVGLVPALAVMLGANVGTTLIVQALSFNVAVFSPALILIGVLAFRRDAITRVHDLGRVLIGLGLMILALSQILQLVTPYEDAPSLRLLLGAVATSPLLDVLLAAGLTWAAHSSVAIILVVMSLAAKGVVPPLAAFALVLGANLGTAINPFLEGGRNADADARRLTVGNLLTRVAGVLIFLVVLEPLGRMLVSVEADRARSVADFHTLFNLAVTALVFPLLTPFARFLAFVLPKRPDPADPSRPLYLDAAAKEMPIVALGSAAREALRLADVLGQMLDDVRGAIAKGDRKQLSEAKQREDVLDRLNSSIRAFLTSIDAEELNEADQRRLEQILTFAMNVEQAGDIVDRNLLPHTAKRLKHGQALSREGEEVLLAMIDRLAANLKLAASLFMTEDRRAARLLAGEKVAFREAEIQATGHHLARLRTGRLDLAHASALHLDLLRDLKQINSHIVAAAAYPVLERAGELLRSRIIPLPPRDQPG